MKAIEIKSKTNKKGELNIHYELGKSEENVRVLILIEDSPNIDEEKEWIESFAKNPAFDFLSDESEDIYSLTDGEPFND